MPFSVSAVFSDSRRSLVPALYTPVGSPIGVVTLYTILGFAVLPPLAAEGYFVNSVRSIAAAIAR